MVGFFDMVPIEVPVLGEIEVAAVVLYFVGFIALVVVGVILYVLGALEKSLLGGGGVKSGGGGYRPPLDEDADEEYEGSDGHEDYDDHVEGAHDDVHHVAAGEDEEH